MSIFEDQHDLMTLAGQLPAKDPDDLHNLRRLYGDTLIPEEYSEFVDALAVGNYAERIKEAFDVVVVATGYILSLLTPEKAQHAWNLVHETNLAKVRNGAIKREDGKFLQTPEYKKELKAKLMADLSDLLK